MSKRLLVFLALVVALVGLVPNPAVTTTQAVGLSVSPVSPLAPASRSPLALELLGLGTVVGLVVKDAATAAAKYKTRAAAAQPDYATGVQNGAQNWEPNTAAAADRYAAGVQDAITHGAFRKGVTGKTDKYRKNATTLGPARFAQGVANAGDAYAAGMAPVISVLSSLQLPPKQVKGMNQDRANKVVLALRALKTGKAA